MADDVVVKEVKAVISASDQSAPGVTAFENRIKNLHNVLDYEGHRAGKSFMNSLNEEIGRRSELAHFAHILEGGGAVAGVTIVAKVLGEAAEKANELVSKFKEGQISAQQMATDLAHSIPVIGQVATAFEQVGKLARNVLGAPSEADRQDEELRKKEEQRKDLDAFQKRAKEHAEHQAKIMEEINKDAQEAAKRDELAGKEGGEKQIIETEQNYREKMQSAAALREKVRVGGLSIDQIEEANRQINAIEASALRTLQEEEKRIYADADKEREKKEQEKAEQSMRMQDKAWEQEQEIAKAQQEMFDKATKRQERQREIGEQLQNQRIDELKAEGHLSQTQEKKLAVAQKYLEKQKDLQKIIDDQNATEDQKRQARQMLVGLGASEDMAMRQAVRVNRRGTAGAESASGLTGLAIAAETRAKDPTDQIQGNTKISAEQTKKANDLLAQILKQLSAGSVAIVSSQNASHY